ncbi:hypothetical protein [Salinarchaeum sp. Harcht-Bsk1]|uniref:hypothetical protein n=1 Tax=Salinarchaeum sp. Harcht-Bsk1 TaxID=1333523 RepID=UPI001181B569|nr:hypothetical protein [Salinarchaeum sp. Harcht-Bsk1]
MPSSPRRRALLKGIGSAGAAGLLAGCSGVLSGGGGGDGSPNNSSSGSGSGTGGQGGSGGTAHTADVQVPTCTDPETLTRDDLNGGATISAGCYRVDSNHEIDSGQLTLESGVVIEFAADAGLKFTGGTLLTTGTPADPVFLVGETAQRGFWQGLRFEGSTADTNLLESAVIAHAGSELWHGGDISRAGLFVRDSIIELNNSTIRNHRRSGLTVPDGAVDLSVSNTVFEANERPARLHPDLVGDFEPSNVVRDNDDDRVKAAGTGSGDTITTDQIWQSPGVPFYVTKNLTTEAYLTVDPGTTIEFKAGKGLDVNGGTLRAPGTAEDPITVRGEESGRGTWQGLRFVNTVSADNLLEHVVVDGAGDSLWHGADRSKAGVYAQNADVQVTIRNCTFERNAVTALTADGGGEDGADLTVEGCSFRDNAVPMRLSADLVDGVAASQSFEGNDGSYVLVGATGSSTRVTADATWAALDVPYRLTRHCRCHAGLTIEPGTTVEAAAKKGIYVPEGYLTADASGADPITFTDAADAEENWRGISVNTAASENRLDDVVVENAGNGLWTGNWDSHASIFVYGGEDNGELRIRNSTIRNSAGHGIAKADSGVLSCGNLQFENVADSDVYEMYTGAINPC